MALNFPNSPTVGQVYTDTTAGFSYEWDGTVWKSYSAASSGQIKVIDDISGSFNGIGKTFALTSNSVALNPLNSASLIINLGGVIQDPSDDYSVSGSNIVFSDAPTGGLTFSGVLLGAAIPVNKIGIESGSTVISDSIGTLNFIGAGNTFAVRGSTIDISISGTDNVRANTLVVSGISTLGSSNGIGTVYVGLGSTALYVDGDARITGILTVGTASITLDGTNNIINVGSGVTISGNTGVVSATTFYGDGSNLSGISVNRFLAIDSRVGVVTVTAFAGILTVFGRTSDTNILV